MKNIIIAFLFLLIVSGCNENPTETITEKQYTIGFIYKNSTGMSIGMVQPDGSGFDSLEFNHIIYNFEWAPDGKSLAYDSYGADIRIISTDGTNGKLIANAQSYCWSMDGTKIYYSFSDSLNAVDVQTNTVQFVGEGREPKVSPTGNELAFLYSVTLFKSRTDGSDRSMISGNYVRQHYWSPDGLRIAFCDALGRIIISDNNGDNASYISGPEGVDKISWSPDGTKLVYHSPEGIFIINEDGTGNKLIANGSLPSWSPDGKLIAYNSGDNIMIIKPDGSDSTKVISKQVVYAIAWSPLPVE